jgi:hypothetical protein
MARSKQAKGNFNREKFKQAGVADSLQSCFKLKPMFSFRRYDANAPWAVSPDGKPATDKIFCELRALEYLEWGKIFQASGGKSQGTNSHFIPLSSLSREAIRRADSINLFEGELFSLRMGAKARLFGVIESEDGRGVFYVIWYDPTHQVCPTSI